jgi:hypothetical protein
VYHPKQVAEFGISKITKEKKNIAHFGEAADKCKA